jgi:hypothetical protein
MRLAGTSTPVVRAIETRDRLAQLREPDGGRIEHRLRIERAFRGFHDGARRGEVGLADFQVHHVPAGRLELAREGLDLHHLERRDPRHARGDAQPPGVQVIHSAILAPAGRA